MTAYVQRFIKCARAKSTCPAPLTVAEIKEAEIKWLSYAQHDDFGDIFQALTNGKSNDMIKKHGLVQDKDCLLRYNGRMRNVSLSAEALQPILLSGRSPVSKLIGAEVHRKLLHGGTNATLVAICQQYWITCGRETVKRVLAQCRMCK